ncbi:hypothetical protein B0H14DRAFT_2652525 [Mycena olivaceomarginata]|nr:hypothetical protein B0H14DRAFT_2652525 [Mycena olivaceomarginata]
METLATLATGHLPEANLHSLQYQELGIITTYILVSVVPPSVGRSSSYSYGTAQSMPRSKGKGKARESSQSQNEGFDADNEDEANEENLHSQLILPPGNIPHQSQQYLHVFRRLHVLSLMITNVKEVLQVHLTEIIVPIATSHDNVRDSDPRPQYRTGLGNSHEIPSRGDPITPGPAPDHDHDPQPFLQAPQHPLFPVFPKQSTGNPKRRSAVAMQMARMVHKHLDELIPKIAQIVPLVTREECALYEAQILLPHNSRLEATSKENFRFDVQGTPRSPWNKSAARVFSHLTIQQLGLPNSLEMFNAITKAFETYVDHIIRRYKLSLKTAEEQALERSKHSKYGRKYQKELNIFSFFTDGRFIGYLFPPLRKHASMLELLGVDGMSSDESGQEDDRDEYKILAPLWRASEDLAGSGKSSGSTRDIPHRRILTNAKSRNKKFVAGLPHNVYDQAWIAGEKLTEEVLYPTPDAYDFNHEPNIIHVQGGIAPWARLVVIIYKYKISYHGLFIAVITMINEIP